MVKRCFCASIVMLGVLQSHAVHAFKMGDPGEFKEVEITADTLTGKNVWVHNRLVSEGLSFGDPVHEDMTLASKKLAKHLPPDLACNSSDLAIEEFLKPSAAPMLGNSVCCSESAESEWCDYANEIRYTPFKDVRETLVTGTRWNDDACHMSYRPKTLIGWAAWMLDPWYRKASNLNYSSHYHDKQFLHSMASSGFNRSDSELESASQTTHKIVTWAEFAFRVAEGSVLAQTPLLEVAPLLEANRRRTFLLLFGGQRKSMTVGEFFAGTTDFDPQHVRQLAMGALMHTIQDSFSASHVQRVNDQLPTLNGRGKVVRFLNYRLQTPALHSDEDKRPKDATQAKASDFHPVALGARMIACAAGGSSEKSNWLKAKGLMQELTALENPNKNPRASAGAYLNTKN